MFLHNISLNNFRNYETLEVAFTSNKILIIGKNAQGKTNLLEAIFYLANLNTPRAKHDADLILWNKDYAQIKASFSKRDMECDLEAIINPPKKKVLKVNSIKKTKASEFCSYLSVVHFCAQDLTLLKGSPDDRRTWLDTAISQIYPAYTDRLNKYEKIRIQKNNYFRALKNGATPDTALLEVFNSQLKITGSNITFLRLNFLQELQKIASVKHTKIAEDETLSISYISTSMGEIALDSSTIPSIENIASAFDEKLKLELPNEIARAQCLVGSHRDDISFFLNNIDAKKFASSGQQRTIVLSLKLAELELVKVKLDAYPLLLLDDVLAELDDKRQNFLLSSIGDDVQMFITSVDTLQFNKEYLGNVELRTIKNGNLCY